MNIPITKPIIDSEDLEAIQAPLKSGWLVQGPYVQAFEAAVAEFCHVPFAAATSSCTTALHLTLLAMGIGPGDTVLVPAFTYIATANAVEHTGAKPVFIDIDIDTYNISTRHIEAYLSNCETKGQNLPRAVIPVHLFGLCADMVEIKTIGEHYGLVVIEDAACAIGSSIAKRSAGAFGIAACFSFHPRKVITTGEGGMIVTREETIADQVKILRDHGAEHSDHQRHTMGNGGLPEFNQAGYNYRMTDIQAALGVSQMKKVSRILKERIQLAENYGNMLHPIEGLSTPLCPKDYRHTYQSYVCRVAGENESRTPASRRDTLLTYFAERGISARPGTHSVPLLGYYRKKYQLNPDQFPNASLAHNNTIALPLFPGMTGEEQAFVTEALSTYKR